MNEASEDTVDGVTHDLLSQESEIIQRYHAGLHAISSPLASNPQAWEQCVVQARRIISDCAESLERGVSVVSGTQIAEVIDLGGERVRQGVHLTHSIRAAMILLDVVLDAMVRTAGDGPELGSGYVAAMRALQQGISRRLEAGSIGYDTFLLSQVREIHDQGRRRLAREIHDQLGNSLSLAMRQIELHELLLRGRDQEVSPQVLSAKAAILETLDTTRQMVTELRRANVSGSLETALKGFAASMGEVSECLQLWVQGSEEWISGQVSEELFMIIRECLRNTFAHASAGNILVNVDIAPHEIQTQIIDDGCGFDLAAVRASGRTNGLDGLQERVNLLGGTVHLDTAPGRGTHVTVWIPIEGRVKE